MAEAKRGELLVAARIADPGEFITVLMKLRQCVEIGVSDIIGSMSRRQIDDLWTALGERCTDVILSLEQPDLHDEQLELTDHVLTLVAGMGLETIRQPQLYIPPALSQTAVIMNGILTSLPELMQNAGFAIVELCETWYHQNLDGRENLSLELFKYLLTASLKSEPTGALLNRIWDLHELLLDLDLSADEHAELRHLLLQCTMKYSYMKNDKGRKLVTVLFGLGSDLVTMLHRSIKQIIPSAPDSLLNRYGEVYFKAWWASTGALRERIERECIQDLMYHAVYASRSGRPNMAKTLRTLLSYFHKKKRQPGVDDLLLRLYQPILWRSLKVANGSVRANAACLLMDAFPLRSDEMGVAEQDALVQKQIDLLQELLFDPCPLVRALSVHGICRICRLYWEMFPNDVLKAFVQKIVEQLAWDGMSADVRLAVFQGLTVLVDQQLSHSLLKVALPFLKNHLRDRSEKVRIGFINLLIKVKSVRTMKIWNVVPMEDLLDRLANDTPPVARRIVDLIGSSFLPDNKPVQTQLSRCVALVDMNVMAARKFYELVPRKAPVQTIGHVLAKICRSIVLLLDRDVADMTINQTVNNGMVDGDDSQATIMEGMEDNGLSLEDTDVIIGLFEVAAIMWTVVKPALSLESNSELNKMIVARYASALPVFFRSFNDARIVSVLYIMAGHIPANQLNMFSKSCMSRLRSMNVDSVADDYNRVIHMMCEWNRTDDVIELISEWLTPVLETEADKQDEEPRRKSVSFAATNSPKPLLALSYMDAILDRTSSRDHVLEKHENEMKVLGDVVAKVKHRIEAYISDEETNPLCSREFMTRALTVYWKMVALFAGKEDEPRLEQTKSLLAWLERLVARLDDLDVEKNRFVYEIIELSLSIVNDMLLVGLTDVTMVTTISQLVIKTIKTQPAPSLLVVTMDTMHCLAEAAMIYDVIDDVIPPLMTSLMVGMTGLVRNEPDTANELLHQCKDALFETLWCYYNDRSRDRPVNQSANSNDVMSTMISLILTETTKNISENGLEEVEKCSDLPPLSGHVMEVMCKRALLTKLFVGELEQLVNVGGILDGISMMAAVCQLLTIISKVSSRTSGLTDVMTSLLTTVEQSERPDKEVDSVMSTMYDDVCTRLRSQVTVST